KPSVPAPAQTHSSYARPRPATAALRNSTRAPTPPPAEQIPLPAGSTAAPHPPPPSLNRRTAAKFRDRASETHPQSRPAAPALRRYRSQSALRSGWPKSSPAPAPVRQQTADAAAAHKAETRPATESPALRPPQSR